MHVCPLTDVRHKVRAQSVQSRRRRQYRAKRVLWRTQEDLVGRLDLSMLGLSPARAGIVFQAREAAWFTWYTLHAHPFIKLPLVSEFQEELSSCGQWKATTSDQQ